ncbi:MAG: PhzF family phenazine biosynthesis isomerase [Betaproteobacteria bacterium]|nr:PhzF family phenazine biosynthesis isomerase [Betaproteobacteria bacterium]
MPEFRYITLDVFTDRPFGGNQLAVFLDASGIPEAQLIEITREFNFSEVTFCYPPADPAHEARVRIFTPGREIPFAGHPTVGTAIALHAAWPGSSLQRIAQAGHASSHPEMARALIAAVDTLGAGPI